MIATLHLFPEGMKGSVLAAMNLGTLNLTAKPGILFPAFVLLAALACCAGCATTSPVSGPKSVQGNDRQELQERWGIEILPVRLSANGYVVDFRYRILDPEKAAPLTDRQAKPYLIDEASGEKAHVPSYGKTGALRSKGTPQVDRTYFVFFGNPKGVVKEGSKVTVVIGDFRVEHLAVE